MNSQKLMRNEILRLVRTRHNSACIDTRRLSVFYNMPEREVRRELTRLADEHVIQLSGWDGHEMRSYAQGRNTEEFLDSSSDGGFLHVDLLQN